MNTLRFVSRAMTFLLSTGALLLGASGPAAGQLAQSPWPMFQHDVQHTGRSAFLGPLFLSGAPSAADVKVWPSFGMIASSPTIAIGWHDLRRRRRAEAAHVRSGVSLRHQAGHDAEVGE